MEPFDDLELCFESMDGDWPGMVICTYHLRTSPLLVGHDVDPACIGVEEWQGTIQAQGRIFFEYDDYIVPDTRAPRLCGALLRHSVDRGEVIGYAGSVGDHSMAPFRFKVPHGTINTTVRSGDKHLH